VVADVCDHPAEHGAHELERVVGVGAEVHGLLDKFDAHPVELAAIVERARWSERPRA